jgi:hypothetical protein
VAALASDGRVVATAVETERSICLRDAATGSVLRRLPWPGPGQVDAPGLTPGTKMLRVLGDAAMRMSQCSRLWKSSGRSRRAWR